MHTRSDALLLCRPMPAGLLAALLLAGCATSRTPVPDAAAEVHAAESAFARTMADRDFAAFQAFIADDAVFINGGQPLRGKPAILAFWKRFFEGPAAPFAWRPEIVEVTAAGNLGYTEGPVQLPDGRVPARFYSTWRSDGKGRWQVVFDNGYDLCEPGKAK